VVGSTGLPTSFLNLGYNSDTNVMYGTHTNTDSLYTVDRATGAATLIGPMTGTENPHGLAYNFNNDTMYLVDSNTDNLYTVNLQTGAVTIVGSTGAGNLLGLAFVPEIPEPSTLAAAGLLSGAALLRRRRAV
jgi:DNA-binding beta-propeller fold protein YncE